MGHQQFIDEAPALVEGDFAVDAFLDGQPVRGIPDNEFEAILGHETQVPVFWIADASATASHGSTLTHSGVTYIVREVRPDGTGVTALILESQAV